jgi:phosphate/sulfate permease
MRFLLLVIIATALAFGFLNGLHDSSNIPHAEADSLPGSRPRWPSTLSSSLPNGPSLPLALSHGTNDARKTMATIAMVMVTTRYVTEFQSCGG